MSSAAKQRRRVITLLAVIAAAAAGGYVVTCAIFPAPIVAKSLAVPALRGTPAAQALDSLIRMGLRGRLADTVTDPLAAAGTVAWQSPAPETQLPQGAVVRLGVSSGPPLVSVPDVTDLDLGLALEVIDAAGLKVGRVDTVRHDGAFGTVLATVPATGANARPGDRVTVMVSSGPPSVPVPFLVGLTLAAARDRLAAAGLRVGTVEQRLEGKAGTVLIQIPGPGVMVTRESGVNIIINGMVP